MVVIGGSSDLELDNRGAFQVNNTHKNTQQQKILKQFIGVASSRSRSSVLQVCFQTNYNTGYSATH